MSQWALRWMDGTWEAAAIVGVVRSLYFSVVSPSSAAAIIGTTAVATAAPST